MIKEITSGVPITCRFLYRETFSYLLKYKLIMAVDLSVRPSDLGVRLVSFTVHIAEDRVIPKEDPVHFKGKIPRVMAWAV